MILLLVFFLLSDHLKISFLSVEPEYQVCYQYHWQGVHYSSSQQAGNLKVQDYQHELSHLIIIKAFLALQICITVYFPHNYENWLDPMAKYNIERWFKKKKKMGQIQSLVVHHTEYHAYWRHLDLQNTMYIVDIIDIIVIL